MIVSLQLSALAIFALLLTSTSVPMVRLLALRVGLVDDPGAGDYKTHTRITPYGGGVAIWLGCVVPLAGLLAGLVGARPDLIHDGIEWVSPWAPFSFFPLEPWSPTVRQVSQVVCALGAATGALVIGLVDDRRALPAGLRLGLQMTLATGLAAFVPGFRLPLPGAGPELAAAAGVLWIVALTNSFNFLDNMNGLAAGLAAICLCACGALALAVGHLPLAIFCLLVVGASAGFLLHNFPVATIFMGDAGGLFLGFLGGAVSLLLSQRLTALAAGGGSVTLGLLPLVVFCVPLYDLVTVVALRLRRGHAPWRGDTNHISHRLVAAGLTRTSAVLVLYALTAATALPCAVAVQAAGAGLGLAVALALLALFGIADLAVARRRTG